MRLMRKTRIGRKLDKYLREADQDIKKETDPMKQVYLKGFAYGLENAVRIVERDFWEEEAVRAIQYWHGVSECDCKSKLPQGGCLKCDMDKIMRTLCVPADVYLAYQLGEENEGGGE